MDAQLDDLLKQARLIRPTKEQLETQRQSFAYGDSHFENQGITRELIQREATRMHEAQLPVHSASEH